MQWKVTSGNLIREIQHWTFPWDKIFLGNLDTFEATSRKYSLKTRFYLNNVTNIQGNIQEESTIDP